MAVNQQPQRAPSPTKPNVDGASAPTTNAPVNPPITVNKTANTARAGGGSSGQPRRVTTEAQVFSDGSSELVVTVPAHITARLLMRAQKQDLGEFVNAEVLERAIEGYVY